jgi:predicted dehydrogenase/threonine dehydrogenase-like Zn-dependent dehydrogenase
MRRMKQVLGRSDGAIVARMPAPVAGPREVLVRNRFSLISAGTETAAMTPGASASSAAPDALFLLREEEVPPLATWRVEGGAEIVQPGDQPVVRTGPAAYAYGLASPPLRLGAGSRNVITVHVRVLEGNVSAGLLTDDGATWLATQSFPYALPELALDLYHDAPRGSARDVRIVVSNHRPGTEAPSTFQIVSVRHRCWAPATPLPLAAPEEEVTAAQRFKRSVKTAVRRWTGQENSRAEQLLRRWHGRLTGDPVAARAAIVGPDDVPRPGGRTAPFPENEMAHQGWALGYSSAGEVIALGEGASEFAVGDLVACAGAGLASHAEVARVPVNLACPLPAGVDPRAGCSATVGAIAMQAVRRAEIGLGDRVLVIGLGLIGQLAAQLAAAAGAVVIGFDPVADRVARARSLGMHDGASHEDDLAACVRRRTAGHGADAVIITAATKSDGPINLAMAQCRRRGRVIVCGDVALNPQRGDFYKKEIDLRMATSYGPGRYDAAYEVEGRDYPYGYVRWTARRNLESYLELLSAGRVDFHALVDVRAPIDDAGEVYRALVHAPQRPIAAILEYPADETSADRARPASRVDLEGGAARRPDRAGGTPRSGAPANVVIVGAGAFGQAMLVPRLLEHPKLFHLAGVVSRRGVEGSNFARTIGVASVGASIDPFLSDPAVHALVIATRHEEHAAQALAGLAAGKHVFVEKPLAITPEQLDRFIEGYAKLPAAPILMVGFNRRFSPALRRLAEDLAGRRGPLIIDYRVNAGRLPADHWTQGPQGGGRNVGEACHMYDVFRFLAGAPLASLRATAIHPCPGDLRANENFVATLRYDDGTIATLTYTALGPKEGLPKERIEVFGEGRAWIVDDFRALVRAGETIPCWSGDVDKGHAAEIEAFGRAIAAGGPPPIPVDELIETTAAALAIEAELT